jgi:hypothetical protein
MDFLAKAFDRISSGGGEAKASSSSAALDRATAVRHRTRELSSSALILGGGGGDTGAAAAGDADASDGKPSTAMFRQISLPTEWAAADSGVQPGVEGCVFGFASSQNAVEIVSEFRKIAAQPVGSRDAFISAAETLRADLGAAWTSDVEAAFIQTKCAYAVRNGNLHTHAGTATLSATATAAAAKTAKTATAAAVIPGQHTYGTALFDSKSPPGPRMSKVRGGGPRFKAGDLLRLERSAESNDWFHYTIMTGVPVDGSCPLPPASSNKRGQVHASMVEVTCSMFRLSPTSEEAVEVKKLFKGSPKQFTVDRIQSPGLWEDYYMMRERLYRRCGGAEGLNEKLAWHGCAGPVVLPIAQGGFDWRLCGLHGTAYGRGAYFAKNSSYSQSDNYSKPDVGTAIKHLFLCRIALGRAVKGTSALQRPPPGFHSAVNDTTSMSIMVTFEIAQAYPMYHVTFKK